MDKVLIRELVRVCRFSSNEDSWLRLPTQGEHFIAYKLSGKTEHNYNGKDYSFTKDSVMVVNGSDSYSVTKHDKDLSAGRGSCIAVHFTTNEPLGMHFSIYDFSHDTRMKSLFFKLLGCWNLYVSCRQPNVEYQCFSYFYEVFARLFALNTQSADPDEHIRMGREYLDHNYYNSTLTVESAAAHARLSPRRFGELFLQTYGITPGKYLTQKRLNEAMRLLVHESMPIYDIAELVGYNDAAYFIRVFHAVTGITPLQYRKMGDD